MSEDYKDKVVVSAHNRFSIGLANIKRFDDEVNGFLNNEYFKLKLNEILSKFAKEINDLYRSERNEDENRTTKDEWL